jgi:ectoine hydroxylase
MLTSTQISAYRTDGFLTTGSGIESDDLKRIRDEVQRLEGMEHPGRVLEKDGTTVRGIHGCHQVSDLFSRLVRLPSMLSVARQLLENEVYVHQVKVNAKRALHGDVWPWHQDYVFWEQKDGMRRPTAVNVALFLDDVTEFNGPLLLIPGSHESEVPKNLPGNTAGAISERNGSGAGKGVGEQENDGSPTLSAAESDEPAWASNLSADLDFRLRGDQLTPLVEEHGIRSATGRAGDLLFFDPRIVHGSGTNMSPFDRTVGLITYNSVGNELTEVASPRPEFLAARDYRPLSPLSGGL